MKYTDSTGTNANEYVNTNSASVQFVVSYETTVVEDPFEALSYWGGSSNEKSEEEKMIEYRAKMASFDQYPRNLFKRYTGSNYRQTRRKSFYRRYIPN